jgi:hypothetical protein
LQRCSAATHGVWFSLLCHMHLAGRTGELCMLLPEMVKLTPCRSSAELVHALTELQTTGTADVMLRNENVTVVNRRMNREFKEREGNRLRVQRFRCNDPVTEKKPVIRHKADGISQIQKSDPKRYNGERNNGITEQPEPETNDVLCRSSLSRDEENQLFRRLSQFVGANETEGHGGHWRKDHLRQHPALLERVLAEGERMIKEGESIENKAAFVEDLIKRWK